MNNSNQSNENPFNQNNSDQQNNQQQNSQQENPFNQSNQSGFQGNQPPHSGDQGDSNLKPWLFGCGGCLVIFIILAIILGACAAGPIKEQIDNFTSDTEEKSTEEKSTEEESTEEESTEEETTEEETSEESTTEESTTEENDNDSSVTNKTSNLGGSINAVGTKITVEKAEFVEPDSKYSKPSKDKILKVYYKLENINNSSLIVGDTNFGVTADGQRVSKFYSMRDSYAGFSFSLKPGQSDEGYVYYDVPDADKYEVHLQLKSKDNSYRMKWNIKDSDLK